MAAVPRLPDRRRRHPRHDRRRGRQPDDGGRGRPGRDAGDGDGRPEQRRHRHRPGPPARDRAAACRCATSRSRARWSTTSTSIPTSGRPTSPGTRRTTRARCAGRSTAEPPLPLDVRKIIARRSLLEFPRGRDLQPRLRDQPADRPGGVGGGDHRPAGPDGRAGDLRRRAGRRQRGRGRLQLPGDDRPAVHVRLLRRRRARHREPLVRRGRRRGQRQRPRLRGPRPRTGRLPEHQRPDAADQLRRDADRAGSRARDRRRASGSSHEGDARQVRAGGPRDLVQRPARPRARPAGPLHHRAGGVRARGGRPRPDRGRARASTSNATSWPGWASGRASPTTCGRWTAASTRPDRWASPPTSGAAARERARRARARPGRPSRARQPAAQPLHRRARSSSFATRWRRSRRADDVRAVVVSGRGERAFSAGSHVGEFEEQAGEAGRERHQLDQDVARRLAELPMPTIAAIEGNASVAGSSWRCAATSGSPRRRPGSGCPR